MKHMLKVGSVGVVTFSWILDIIDTCRTCRQNKELEGDILFCKTWQVQHIIDRADWRHDGMEILISSGCEVHERACGQHARMPEQRRILPCHSMYCDASQPKEEGVTWTSETLHVNCIIAGNVPSNAREMTQLVSHFGSTPALFYGIKALQEDYRPEDPAKHHMDPKEGGIYDWRG